MAITSGDAASANEVMNAMGQLFVNQAQLIYSDDTSEDDLMNTFYSEHESDDMTAVNMIYDASDDVYLGPYFASDAEYDTIDEFNDSSVDATIWTSATSGGTITESASEIRLFNAADTGTFSASVTLEGSGSVNLTDDYSEAIRVQTNSVTNAEATAAGAHSAFIQIDGSVSGTMKPYHFFEPTNTPTSNDTAHTVDVIRVGNTAYGFVDGVFVVSGSIVGNMTVKIGYTVTGGTVSGDFKLDWIRYYDFSSPTNASVEQTTADTASATVTNATLTANILGDTNVQYALSADDGANFENATEAEIHRFTDTGTELKTKFTWSSYAAPFALDKDALKYSWY